MFGAVRPTDRIPAYRLALKVNLPPLAPPAAVWRQPLAAELDLLANRGLVVDCRSSTYEVDLAPPARAGRSWLLSVS